MSAHTRLASVLTRLASATSVRRTRAEDEARLLTHGGTTEDALVRLDRTATRLEGVAAKLEQS